MFKFESTAVATGPNVTGDSLTSAYISNSKLINGSMIADLDPAPGRPTVGLLGPNGPYLNPGQAPRARWQTEGRSMWNGGRGSAAAVTTVAPGPPPGLVCLRRS